MALHMTQLQLSYGSDEVLRDVSAIVRPRDRVALVGRNGAGKTTLLRILAGELAPDAGTLQLPPGARVALHDQRHHAGRVRRRGCRPGGRSGGRAALARGPHGRR